MSPAARSLRYLRERGYMVGVVERWNPGARVRQDLFRFADLLAVGHHSFLAVQVCTTGDMSKRVAKLESDGVRENVQRWIEAGGRVEVHGWAKRGPRGKRKTWEVTEVVL